MTTKRRLAVVAALLVVAVVGTVAWVAAGGLLRTEASAAEAETVCRELYATGGSAAVGQTFDQLQQARDALTAQHGLSQAQADRVIPSAIRTECPDWESLLG